MCYLKLENLVSNFEHPCIMDLKIGKRTYDPFATPDKIHRELIRYDYQAQLGFRITGFKVYKAKTGRTELYDRFHCKRFKPNDMEQTLAYFFDLENYPERVFLMAKLLQKLKRLMKWFKTQKRIKFYCTSLLIAYDGSKTFYGNIENKHGIYQNSVKKILLDPLTNKKGLQQSNLFSDADDIQQSVQKDMNNLNEKLGNYADLNFTVEDDMVTSMIDFTHTFIDMEGMTNSVDENYIYGLQTLIDIFQNMLP